MSHSNSPNSTPEDANSKANDWMDDDFFLGAGKGRSDIRSQSGDDTIDGWSGSDCDDFLDAASPTRDGGAADMALIGQDGATLSVPADLSDDLIF